MKNKGKSQRCNKFKPVGVIMGAALGVIMGALLGNNMLENGLVGAIIGVIAGALIGFLFGLNFDGRVNSNAYIVKDVIEEDYGCEGILVGEEKKVTIVIADKHGNEEKVRMNDELALKYNIEENDRVILKNGTQIVPIWRY